MDPYGGLAAVFGLMAWMGFSATIVFLGAAWNAESSIARTSVPAVSVLLLSYVHCYGRNESRAEKPRLFVVPLVTLSGERSVSVPAYRRSALASLKTNSRSQPTQDEQGERRILCGSINERAEFRAAGCGSH